MTDLRTELTEGADTELMNTPVVGFIATRDNTDALVRSVVRAKRNGYECLVAFKQPPPESVSLVQGLGATILKPEHGGVTLDALKRTLVSTARAQLHPGIILSPPDCPPIDYTTSSEKLQSNGAFYIEAIPQSLAEPQRTPDVVVAIPAYNEESTIGAVVEETKAYADVVLVVDDGSTDDTVAAAEAAGAEVVEHQRNRGYGAALKTAFSEASGYDARTLVTLDADGQHDPSDIPKLVERLNDSNTEMVIGSRFEADNETALPFYRRFGIWTVNVLTNLSMGIVREESWVNDTQCGFRAYGSTAIRSVANDDGISSGMGASTDILYHAHHNDYGIEEVGTTVSYDVENANNQNPLRHGFTLVQNILRTIERDRPLTALGVPGFIVTLFGLFLGYWSIATYSSTEPISIGLVAVAIICSLFGLLFCFTALILHSLTVHFATEGAR